jgi:hypothetical protein
MAALKRIAVTALRGIRWLLLAVAAGAVWLADVAAEAAERLQP